MQLQDILKDLQTIIRRKSELYFAQTNGSEGKKLAARELHKLEAAWFILNNAENDKVALTADYKDDLLKIVQRDRIGE